MLKLVHNADATRSPKSSSNLMTLKERINQATSNQAPFVEKQESLNFSEARMQAEKTSA